MSPTPPSDWSMLRRVLPWLRPYARQQGVLFALLAISTLAGLASPFVSRFVVDEVFMAGNLELLPQFAGLMVLATVVSGLLSLGAGWLQTWITGHMLIDLRVAAIAHLHVLGPAWFARRRVGDVLTRLGSDLAEVQKVAAGALLQLAMGVLSLVGVTGALLWLSPRLFLVGLAFVPVVVGLMVGFRPRTRRLSQDIRDRNAGIASQLLEGIQALRFIKASHTEEFEQQRFATANRGLVEQVLALRLWQGSASAANALATTLSAVVVMVVGARELSQGRLSAGDLVAFFLLQQRFYRPINGFAGLYLGLQRARAAMLRVFEIFDARPAVEAPAEPLLPALQPPEFALRFEGVRFRYGSGEEVLAGVDLAVPAGTSLALVGASGVGKTTLIDLLLRLQAPTEGRIVVDGQDLAELDMGPLLDHTALVSQQAVVFRGSVAHNLAYGRTGLDEEQMIEALDRVGLADWLDGLPLGLRTEIGERGATVSAGQAQRLSIARALLRRPRLLLLDEGTSALDWLNDRKVSDALGELAGSCTTVIVTHRLGLAARADQIAVLHRGQVVQQGGHDELLEDETGLYRRLWAEQRRGRRRGPPARPGAR